MDYGYQWIWAIWLFAVMGSFGFLEGWALYDKHDTLSRTMWIWQSNFPLLAVVYGIIFGGLAVHFFWTNEGLGVPRSN